MPLPAIIGAGASLLGNFGGALINHFSNKAAGEKNEAFQRELATHGIRYRVRDAQLAGVHPLAALGAPTFSPGPSHVGDTSLGDAFARSGQDISRSIEATRTVPEKVQKLQDLQLERGELENELLRSRLARESATPMVSGPVLDVPLRRTMSRPGAPHMEVGSVSDVGFADVAGGGKAPVMSKDIKERLEDNELLELLWARRNLMMPDARSRPKDSPGKGKEWRWSQTKFQWEAVDKNSFWRKIERMGENVNTAAGRRLGR